MKQPMKVETKKLKLFLLDSGLITSKDIAEAERNVKKTGEDLGDALVSTGKISEDDLRRLEAYILGIPFVGLIPFFLRDTTKINNN